MSRLWIWAKEAFWLIVAVALVAGGVMGFQYLGANKTVVEATPVARPVALVATEPLALYAEPLPIRGEGFIEAFREVALSAQVSGRIEELHPAIERRGSFEKGDVLARLDDRAARATLAQTDANIASTEARLDLTLTRLKRSEQLIERGIIAQETLDQLLSQEAELSASLDSLKAARRAAEITLENAEITAPFDGTVLAKSAELGSVVNPGQEIARLYTADILEVTVPVRPSDAALIPGLFEGSQAKSTVRSVFAGRTYVWDSEVVRVDNALDARTRTLNVTLRLKDRNASEALDEGVEIAAGRPPALINAFAHAVIEGASLPDTFAVPSTSFRDGGVVWLYRDGALRIQPATLIHVDGEQSFVQMYDLPDGAELITSALDAAVDGMDVRRATDDRRSTSNRN